LVVSECEINCRAGPSTDEPAHWLVL